MNGELVEALRRQTARIESDGSGSGVVTAEGLVTNRHVVGKRERVLIHFWDGREIAGRVVKRHPRRDLALVRVEGPGPLSVAKLASQVPRPGSFAMAVGNPLGFVGALSTGVVRAVGPLRGLGSQPWVQVSVRLAPGNSGGPLADAEGRVIGINTMVASGGLGLAIPADAIRRFLSGPVYRLGVTVRPVPGGQRIVEMDADGSAARASLRIGDVLLQDSASLDLALETSRGLLPVRFLRGGTARIRNVMVQLAQSAIEAAA
jgi:serine protease Do